MADNAEAGQEHATLKYPGGELELDIVHATEGSDGIALGSLLAKTGYTTFDGGFVNTASTKSAITYIDGDAGILRYRGYPDRAAGREVDVPRGQLPADLRRTADRGATGRSSPARSSGTRCCTRISSGSSTASRATRIRCRCSPAPVNALSAYYQDSLDPFDPEQVELSTIRLLAKLPTIAAYAYKKSDGPAVPLPGQLADAWSRTSCG